MIRPSPATGVARFVRSADGTAIDVAPAAGKQRAEPLDFFRTHGNLFGVTAPDTQLVIEKEETDNFNQRHTVFHQVHQGVPVFAALLHVHSNAQGEILAVNGTFVPDIHVDTKPVLSTADAAAIALSSVAKQFGHEPELKVAAGRLYVYRANLARGVPGPNYLVYEIEVGNGANVREFVYVDAHKGYVVDQVTGICSTLYREIYDQSIDAGNLIWWESEPLPYGDVDVDHLIAYAEDTYNLVASATSAGFLSWDGLDGPMTSVNGDVSLSCPNAHWTGFFTGFCAGMTGDDTVAHEWGHAYTESTHGLIYQWQPGALNEAYSDIYGEVVDLLNGAGTDSPNAGRTSGDCTVFRGLPPPSFQVNSPSGIAGAYLAGGAYFNPDSESVTADVELVNDGDNEGGAGTVTDGCQALIGFTAGDIALIDSTRCLYTTKAENAAAAGASGVIIFRQQSDTVYHMDGSGEVAVPSVLVGQGTGDAIRNALPGVNASISVTPSTANSYRWLSGEDDPASSGAIRDMWNPTCMLDPGKVSDPLHYYCGTSDGGGVHTNSGVPNHAFALLVDGGTYNGQTVTGIGLTKAFHIYWRAQSVYQVPASDFADHADALEQSCADLIGVDLFALSTDVPTGSLSGEIISAADCAELANAIAAVEMRAEPAQCGFAPVLNPVAPSLCGNYAVESFFLEDWEGGLGTWTAGTRDVAKPATFDTPDWAAVGGLPDGRSGSAAFVADLVIGNCADDTEAGVLYLESPVINTPPEADSPHIAFDHWVATEAGWDGGNVKISVNGGAYSVIPGSAFDFNGYNDTLRTAGQGSDNPMAGEEAFTGSDGGAVSGSWGQSQIDLTDIAGPGDDIQLRFEMGIDGCNGLIGWYVDNVQMYSCGGCLPPEPCEVAKLTGTGANAFGFSASMNGNVALIGASGSNSAHVFTFDSGSWIEAQKLTASDGASGDSFGVAVSISGDAALVGAWGDDCAAGNNCGAAYAFRFNGTSWTEEQKFVPNYPGDGDIYFGVSVSVDGNVAVVGAIQEDCPGGIGCGAAYVYRFDGSTWIEEQKLTAPGATGAEQFGWTVAVKGDVAFVTARNRRTVYVYHFDGAAWIMEQGLTVNSQPTQFGSSIAIDSDVAVIGDDLDAGCGYACGTAYVYRFDGATWVQEQELNRSGGVAWDYFGGAAAINGDTILIGARLPECDAGENCGAAYLYRYDGVTWVEEQKLAASDESPNAEFGHSVALSMNRALVGARWKGCCGAAYMFGISGDCDCDGTADACEIMAGADDCNQNGIPDSCDLEAGVLFDADGDGVSDACEHIRYVKADATGENDGLEWSRAFSNIQDALIAAAASDGIITEIWVAAGDYFPTTGFDRSATFQLLDNVTLYGGFNGTETLLEQRDSVANPTYLNGNIGDDLSPTDNSYHVVTGSGCGPTAALDGFRIRNGYAHGSYPENSGAGMYNNGGSPTVVNCMFEGNDAGFGGGIFNDTASPTLIECTFLNNQASASAGGVYNYDNSSPSLTGCTFNDNLADFGGAIFNGTAADPTFIGCSFEDNSADYGGAIYNETSSPSLANCAFTGNGALFGGAIVADGSSDTLVDCTFDGNTASGDAGAIDYFENATGVLVNCEFYDNVAYGDPVASGGVSPFGGGAVALFTGESITFTNCTLVGNRMEGVDPTDGGGGIFVYDGCHADVGNSVLWGNTALGAASTEDAQIHLNGTGTVSVTHSCISDDQPGDGSIYPGQGNIDNDPMFADVIAGDLHLTVGSPCIDAGNNDIDTDTTTPEIEPIPGMDLGGNPRFTDDGAMPDSGVGTPPIVDMGAFESPGDCNSNGIPDETELDSNGDGIIDDCVYDGDGDGVSDDDDLCPLGETGWVSNGTTDNDGDGCRDATEDTDDDNDGVGDVVDLDPLDPDTCEDVDSDGCDDCAIGTDDFGPLADNDPTNDGVDTDSDGQCDTGDSDDDNDGVLDTNDLEVLDPNICLDSDGDTCDDCALGTDDFGPLPDNDPANDGPDADSDGICDAGDNCDLYNPDQLDCQPNGIGDVCDITDCVGDAACADCQPNGIPDECDISSGIFQDVNGNGVPDECELAPPVLGVQPHDRLKNRYISFQPGNAGLPVGFKVTLTDSIPHPGVVGSSWWVQAPITAVPGQFPKPLVGLGECVAMLGPEATAAWIDWETAGCQVLHVTGCAIEPTSTYDVQAVTGMKETEPLSVATVPQPEGAKWWGDTVGYFNGTEWTPPQGVTNIDDAVAAIKTWQGGQVIPPGPIPPGNVAHLSIADVEPGDINVVVNFNDVFTLVQAFKGDPYSFGPADVNGNCP